MKRLLLASVAVALLAIPVANAQQPGRGPGQPTHATQGPDRGYDRGQDRGYDGRWSLGRQQAWKKGQRLPQRQWGGNVDYRRHHLNAPPRGYRWVQQGNQYLMVGIASGIIASILSGH